MTSDVGGRTTSSAGSGGEPPAEGDVGWRDVLGSAWSFLSFTAFLHWFGAHSLRPFVTLRLDELGASDAFIGAAVALSPVASLALAIPGGRLVDRVGARRVLFASLAAMASVGVGFAHADSRWSVLQLQAVIGIAEVGSWLALQALVTHAGSGRFRTRQLSLFAFAWGAGVAAGPVAGAWLYEALGFAALGWAYAAAAASGALSVVLVPRPRLATAGDAGSAPRSTVRTVRDIAARVAVRAVLLSSFVNLAINAIRSSFYPLFLERAGVPIAGIGYLLSIVAVTSLVIRVLLPPLVERFGVVRLLVWSMAVSTVALSVTPWLQGFAALAVAAAAMGATVGMNPPITVELMALHTTTDERGVAMGMRITANRLGMIAQPALFTALAAAVGMAAAFPLSGVALLAVTAWTARQVRRAELSVAVG